MHNLTKIFINIIDLLIKKNITFAFVLYISHHSLKRCSDGLIKNVLICYINLLHLIKHNEQI